MYLTRSKTLNNIIFGGFGILCICLFFKVFIFVMHNTAYVVGYVAQEYNMTIICPREGCAILLSCNEFSDRCMMLGMVYIFVGILGILIFTIIFIIFIQIILLIVRTIVRIYKECTVIEQNV